MSFSTLHTTTPTINQSPGFLKKMDQVNFPTLSSVICKTILLKQFESFTTVLSSRHEKDA